jgi:two-component system chemotaxis response regulator CheB
VGKHRILVVDDAAVIRRLVADEIAADPALEVVGTAANGKIALAKLPQVNPDLVILDVEMPELDGLATLRELRKTYPKLPVIMFSSLTERGAETTLDALALGATDYFTKPTSASGPEASLEILRTRLIPKIKALCAAATPRPLPAEKPVSAIVPPPGRTSPVEVVAIGTSTGGPNALAEIVSRLPAHFPVPLLIVQHMPPMFTKLLADRLTTQGPIPIQEAMSGREPLPGQGWIAPGDYHIAVVRNGTQVRLLTHQEPPENSCRPSVDVLLRSVARVYGAHALAVILTGMGQDGLRGCEAIREAGGQVLVQDESSSVVWGMPGFVARAGLADRVLPLPQLAGEITARVRR